MADEGQEALEIESFFDELEGGEETSHSPEAEEKAPEESNADELIPEEDDEFSEDSVDSETGAEESQGKEESEDPEKNAKETAPVKSGLEEENARLKGELEGLRKRFHDTQSAMHKATGERSKLQKELDELKAKRENSDDWFSEEDAGREKELESALKKNAEETERVAAQAEELAKEEREAAWDAAVSEVKKTHPDFEQIVYDGLVPLLDEQTGNPQVRKAWLEMQDKSPLATYQFARRVKEIFDFQRDPEGYRDRLRKEIENEMRTRNTSEFESPTGKAGLDMVQSMDFPEEKENRGTISFVDDVFG